MLVSGTAKDLVAGSGIAFDARGVSELKGLGEWPLYDVAGLDQVSYSSNCGRPSVISNHGAFEPMKMCEVGRMLSSPATRRGAAARAMAVEGVEELVGDGVANGAAPASSAEVYADTLRALL